MKDDINWFDTFMGITRTHIEVTKSERDPEDIVADYDREFLEELGVRYDS